MRRIMSATYHCGSLVFFALFTVALLAIPPHAKAEEVAQNVGPALENAGFPKFRFPDVEQTAPPQLNGRSVVLLTDQDFAPWSFVDAAGHLRGISVDLALGACTTVGLTCRLQALPFGDLRSALNRKEGDVIITGLRAEANSLQELLPTKPYFISLGRFVVRQGSSLPSSDPRALAGKRLGFVRNSAHGTFLQKHFARSTLTAYDKLSSLQEALRTGAVDAAFADAMAMSFWLSGNAARKCCQPLGRAFVDRDGISRGLFFSVRPDQPDLRDLLDVALDMLEEKGDTARIFTSYLPAPVW
jgi:polar amino acid transport system substrate-binding protein